MKKDFSSQPASKFDFEFITYEKKGARATVTFNRPDKLNCVHYPMLKELAAAFDDVAFDDEIAVLILTGKGDRAFCTGADLNEQLQFLDRPQDYWKWMGAFIDAHDKLRNLGKPSIARLNGIVVGGGNEFNISCDLAIAADDIYIRQVGAAHGSVAAAGASQFLPLIVGDRRAREILFLCEEIPAQKALEWGLVNQVVPRANLDQAVDEMAAKLEAKLPECVRYLKTQINYWRDMSWAQTINHARDWLGIHANSPEVREAVMAFNSKRKPDYKKVRESLKRK
ncbi:MAG: enoyl-CoA hydratase/isomerase family protein [Calditrichaeota bacterium]|nr:enoyl-CoA hydratase/isomerase family protein [Calditrichota bacterium]MCB9368996.1 enoyl-CoA hydratase/isomerase family protein [Calditrichota bacterium]